MSAARIIAVVVGVFLMLVGLAFVVPGGVLLWAYGTQRDSDGFFESSDRLVSTADYALVSPDIDVDVGPDAAAWMPEGVLGAVRMEVVPAGEEPVFIGIGPTDRVTEYLAGVPYDEVTDLGWSGGVDYRRVDGAGVPPSTPAEQDFWVAQAEGSGGRAVEWDVEDGRWTAVIMNADATPEVSANLGLGARFDLILAIGIGLAVAGVVLLGIGSVLMILGLVGTRRRDIPSAETPEPPAAEPPTSPPAAPTT